jgi:outer membrane cobalamin receptor
MSFYTEIQPFIEYFHSMRKLKDYFIFDMKFSSKWTISKSLFEDGNIVPFELDNTDYKGISFVSPINETEIEKTISKIGKIIKMNKEREFKERLFKEYVDKLKNTFESNSIDKLKNLHFEFEDNNIKLDNHESVNEPEIVELVEPREEERRNTREELQKQVDKRNKTTKKGGVVSEA